MARKMLREARAVAVGMGLAGVLALSGCGTASIEDAVPVSQSEREDLPLAGSGATRAAAFSQPGQFPNLNVRPVPAAAQITPDEKAETTALLGSIRERAAAERAAARPVRDVATLRRLARSHASSALKEIEGE